MKVCLACGKRFDAQSWSCPNCLCTPANQAGIMTFAPQAMNESEGFKPEYHVNLYSLESDNFWFRARNKLIMQTLKRYFPQVKNCLEIGCGTGYVLSGIRHTLPKIELYGSEILIQGLHFAKGRLPDCQFFQMDARQIPFDNELDLICAFDVLEHIQEDEAALAQMRQAVRDPNGGILITVPQHPFLWGPADEYAHHVRRYRADELRQKVEQAGFQVTYMTSFVSLLLPAMLLSRLTQRNKTGPYDPMSEFNISKALNQTLEKVMDIERAMISWGVSFPIGGSLLLAATTRKE